MQMINTLNIPRAYSEENHFITLELLLIIEINI